MSKYSQAEMSRRSKQSRAVWNKAFHDWRLVSLEAAILTAILAYWLGARAPESWMMVLWRVVAIVAERW
jgi:hypothetical protein